MKIQCAKRHAEKLGAFETCRASTLSSAMIRYRLSGSAAIFPQTFSISFIICPMHYWLAIKAMGPTARYERHRTSMTASGQFNDLIYAEGPQNPTSLHMRGSHRNLQQ
ncbi:hypothetical protein GLAREA_10007 [Glarea lozoyensis ATCC 20868]|uniref:Uncharacterized protein n=1 Tax=Glarea lozoyensis (strain ATCC 20868 / MF5171) TaxID=1116229 RepID=S3E7M7_GLAL2|nr:uncharacterized protein GLAREA_10007 [Glarea lozoyensis ATCC 20868]EPE34313.1 hypothetical protein GLAREA_10007 [Glarea lozoyensis ATCC 20868]